MNTMETDYKCRCGGVAENNEKRYDQQQNTPTKSAGEKKNRRR